MKRCVLRSALLGLLAALLVVPTLAQQPMVLEYWDPTRTRVEVHQKYFDLYTQLNPHITFNAVVKSGMPDALSIALATDIIPDLVMPHRAWATGLRDQFAVWSPEYFPTRIWDDIPVAEHWRDERGDIRWINLAYTSRLAYANKRLWDESGLSTEEYLPISRRWTWAEAGAVGQKLTRVNADNEITQTGFGFSGAVIWHNWFITLIFQQGGQIYSRDGLSLALDQYKPEALNALQIMYDFYHHYRTESPRAPNAVNQYQQEMAATVYSEPNLYFNVRRNQPHIETEILFHPTVHGGWDPSYAHTTGPIGHVVPDALPDERKREVFKFLAWLYQNEDWWVDIAFERGGPPVHMPSLMNRWELRDDPIMIRSSEVVLRSPHLSDDPNEVRDVFTRMFNAVIVNHTAGPVQALENAIVEGNAEVRRLGPLLSYLSYYDSFQ